MYLLNMLTIKPRIVNIIEYPYKLKITNVDGENHN